MKSLFAKFLLAGMALIVLNPLCIIAQAPNFIKLEEYIYGGIVKDQHYGYWPSIYLMPDRGFYVLSVSSSNISGNKTEPNCLGVDGIVWADAWLIRCDSSGNILWQKTYGGPNDGDDLILMQIEPDGDLFLAGNSSADAGCEKSQNAWGTANNSDFWVICVDAQGNKKWDRRYGSGAIEFLKGALPTDDGGYLLYGSSFGNMMQDVTDTSNGSDEGWLLKIDSVGTPQWNKLIGGGSYDYVSHVMKTGTNEYTLLATTYNGAPSGDWIFQNYTGLGSPDGWIIRIDTLGNILSQNHYGGINADVMGSGCRDVSGNLLTLSALSKDTKGGDISDSVSRGLWDTWLLKIDPVGNKLFDRRIGGNLNDGPESIYHASEGSFYILCRSNSDAGNEKSENSKGGYDVWLLKLDSALNILWDKTIGGNKDEGEPSIAFVNDSVFYLCLQSGSDISGDKALASFDTVPASMTNRADMWVTKWLMSYTTAAGVEQNVASDFQVYPNPATDYLTIRFSSIGATLQRKKELTITDLTGRKIVDQTIPANESNCNINVSHLSQGVYFIHAGNRVKKFVKQ